MVVLPQRKQTCEERSVVAIRGQFAFQSRLLESAEQGPWKFRSLVATVITNVTSIKRSLATRNLVE